MTGAKVTASDSKGLRVVLCTRADCAFTGDMVSGDTVRGLGAGLGQYYVCEAELIVLDRSTKGKRLCGRYARK